MVSLMDRRAVSHKSGLTTRAGVDHGHEMLLPDPRPFDRAVLITLPLCIGLSLLSHGQAHARTHHHRHFHHHAHRHHASGTVLASYYGGGERLNKHTANGEVFRPNGLTAAHRTLPLGTKLLVSHGGKSVVVRVNDRGPAAWTGRQLDLSRGAAARLGFIKRGEAPVRISVLRKG